MLHITRTITRWLTLCLAGWFLAATSASCNAEEPLKLTDETVLNFASVEQGRKLIGARDDFVKRVGELEIQLRLESVDPVTKEDYLKGMQAGVTEWKKDDIELIKAATEKLRERMKEYRLPFPKQIHLIRVTAKVEGNAPHCRAASIILPDSFFANAGRANVILAHELFHVLSSHNPKLRDRLYKVIHFERTKEVALPPSLRPQRLTNPDAPSNEHVIHLTINEIKTPVVPVTLTRTAKYKPGGLFAHMDFKLMVLEEKDGAFVAKLKDGHPQLLGPREVPDYLRKIGRNTGYIIHPEETMADNFWMMVLESERVQDAWVIEGMKEILKK